MDERVLWPQGVSLLSQVDRFVQNRVSNTFDLTGHSGTDWCITTRLFDLQNKSYFDKEYLKKFKFSPLLNETWLFSIVLFYRSSG